MQICLPVRQAGVPYREFRSLSYLFYGFYKFVGGFSFFGHLNRIGIHISDRFWLTECDTLGIAIAKITFHSYPLLDIKEGVPKRACDNTSPASDTQIFVNHHSVVVFGLPVAGFGRTDFDAIGFFTVIAGHGEIDPHVLPLDHFNPGPAWVARPGMIHGTDQLTEAASRTFLLIHDQYLLLHVNSPLFSSFSTHT
jgi:hypothetical protein